MSNKTYMTEPGITTEQEITDKDYVNISLGAGGITVAGKRNFEYRGELLGGCRVSYFKWLGGKVGELGVKLDNKFGVSPNALHVMTSETAGYDHYMVGHPINPSPKHGLWIWARFEFEHNIHTLWFPCGRNRFIIDMLIKRGEIALQENAQNCLGEAVTDLLRPGRWDEQIPKIINPAVTAVKYVREQEKQTLYRNNEISNKNR